MSLLLWRHGWQVQIAAWLRTIADWLEPRPADPLLAHARVLTAQQDAKWPARDGETKRAQVYSALMKAFPEASKRSLSRAIERAIGN